MNTEFQSEQMAEMARLYYMEGRNQTEIGERFGISRFKVAQYIQEAARRGIVEIKIHTPVKRDGGQPVDTGINKMADFLHVHTCLQELLERPVGK